MGSAFRTLHEAPGAFIIPNPWDGGSARMLADFGFKALATTSAGHAISLGIKEETTARDAVPSQYREIATAPPLPVSADLEKRFGDTSESVAETIRAAAKTSLAGCSIEDHADDRDAPISEFGLDVERIVAAVEAASELTARLRADGPCREPALESARARRRHQAPACLRGRRCRCALCAGSTDLLAIR
ncbi:MAG: isocitrate lyase/phosphoenolpyruvate mutase family protein [Hyphomicrobiaceae bacterium]